MHSFQTGLSRPRNRTWPWLFAGGAALIVGAAGVAARLHNRDELRERAESSALPLVTVVAARKAPPTQELALPATVQAYTDAPIYARTNGYLKRWYADIGAHVKAGQPLAEIDTPEIDQQLHQVEADAAQAKANERLAAGTAQRYRDLLATDSVSKQDAEDKAGDYEAKKATLDAAQANLARLRDTQGFKRIVAPFDGTITARHTDVGQLVSNASGTELFHIADLHKLRIYVQVPQTYAAAARPGVTAELRTAERADQPYPARIVRTANALDASTRTLLTELEVDNPRGELLPGSYAEVRFKLEGAIDTIRVPANVLIFRAEGTQVASLQAGNKVKLSPVVLGRDFGTQLEIVSGVREGDRLVVNPPDSLADGDEVRVAEAPQAAPAAAASPGGANPGTANGQTSGAPGAQPEPQKPAPSKDEGKPSK